jgi:H+-transporting ATPase
MTQVVATLIVVYGLFVTPIGWKLALLVWGYAAVAFVLTDILKVRFYGLLKREGIIFGSGGLSNE